MFTLNAERLDDITNTLINGLITDGAHHKQWYLERALQLLAGDDFYKDAETEFEWEEGIPS